jgi:DNA modification methylase
MDTSRSGIVKGDCMEVIPSLPDGSVSACITSPPYAMQRKMLYGGVTEK